MDKFAELNARLINDVGARLDFAIKQQSQMTIRASRDRFRSVAESAVAERATLRALLTEARDALRDAAPLAEIAGHRPSTMSDGEVNKELRRRERARATLAKLDGVL